MVHFFFNFLKVGVTLICGVSCVCVLQACKCASVYANMHTYRGPSRMSGIASVALHLIAFSQASASEPDTRHA